MYYTEARIICIRIYIYIYFITVVVEFVALHRVLPPSIAAVVETIRTGYDRKLNNKKKEKKEKKRIRILRDKRKNLRDEDET